jgi:cell division protein FtsQ
MPDAPERPGGIAPKPPTARDVRRAQAVRRRAQRKEFRRFTVSTRKRRINAIAGVSSLLALVFAVVILTTSPIFSLQKIELYGLERLSESEVRGQLSGLIGTPLAQVGPGVVAGILAEFPLVRSVETRVDLPNTLVVSVVERKPLGAVQTSTGFDVVDQAAVVLWSESAKPTSLPVILVAPDRESAPFRAIVRALEVLPPSVLARVDAVTANSQDTVRFSLQDSNHIVLWGSAELSEAKARALPAALIAAGPEGAKLIDLSTPDTVVIRDVG